MLNPSVTFQTQHEPAALILVRSALFSVLNRCVSSRRPIGCGGDTRMIELTSFDEWQVERRRKNEHGRDEEGKDENKKVHR